MQSIEQLSAILLDHTAETTVVNGACSVLYDLFVSAATTTADAVRSTTPSRRLTAGLALSPALAAQCLLDGRRTAAFVRGSLRAIQEAERRFAPSVIEVLYAGTGPFAPLAFLLMPFLNPANVRFTLLEVNEASARSVDALIGALGGSKYVREVVCGDATTYQHPAQLHVVISETMQRTLREEPFVAILRNIRPQLAAGALVVPERVTIELALLDAESQQRRWRGEPGPVEMEDWGIVFQVDAKGEFPFGPEASTTLTVRCEASGDAKWLALATRIRVHGDEVLDPYASGLTMPEVLWPLSPLTRDTTIELRYDAGPHPRVVWRELWGTPSAVLSPVAGARRPVLLAPCSVPVKAAGRKFVFAERIAFHFPTSYGHESPSALHPRRRGPRRGDLPDRPGRLLLCPSQQLNNIILGVLGRAQRKFPVEIVAYVFASNHFHLLLRVDPAKQLSDFMCYLNSNLAKEIGPSAQDEGTIDLPPMASQHPVLASRADTGPPAHEPLFSTAGGSQVWVLLTSGPGM